MRLFFGVETYKLGNIPRIESKNSDGTHVSYFCAVHKLHGQQPMCTQVPVHLRGINPFSNVGRQPPKIVQTLLAVLGLVQEIQFLVTITEPQCLSSIVHTSKGEKMFGKNMKKIKHSGFPNFVMVKTKDNGDDSIELLDFIKLNKALPSLFLLDLFKE